MKRPLLVGTLLAVTLAGVQPASSQAPKAAPRTSPRAHDPEPTAPPPPPPTTVDVRAFGARADGRTDSTAAIQRAINAAEVASEAHQEGGAIVFLPSGPGAYIVSGPLFVDGRSLEVRGEGPGTQVRSAPGYGGPIFVFGVKRLSRYNLDAWRFRKDSRGVLDASARSGSNARSGLTTRGEASVVVQAHPLQLGGPSPTYKGIIPDYWSETRQLTLEFCLARPRGVTWEPWSGLFGLWNVCDEPAPWFVRVGETGNEIALSFRTDDQAPRAYHLATVPLPNAHGPWRVTLQLDLEAGAFSAWVNGTRAPAKLVVALSPRDDRFRPGLSLQRQDGVAPFTIGAAKGFVPFDSPVTDLELYGLRVSRGLVYRMTASSPEPVAFPGTVDDLSRYFTFLNTERVQTVGLLPLDELAGTVVKLKSLDMSGCGFWVPAKRGRSMNNLVIKDIRLWAELQQAVALGEVYDFRAENVHAGRGLQGIGGLSLGSSYPIILNNCKLSGHDAAYFGFLQILYATNTVIDQSGREAIRICGGSTTWDRTFLAFFGPHTEAFVRYLDGSLGQVHRITDMNVDNEGGGPKRAVVECEQGANCVTRLVIDGLDVSTLDPGAAFLRLIGHGPNPNYRDAYVNARNLSVNGLIKTALRADGQGWHGTFDASGLPSAPVAGDGHSRIRVTVPSSPP